MEYMLVSPVFCYCFLLMMIQLINKRYHCVSWLIVVILCIERMILEYRVNSLIDTIRCFVDNDYQQYN